MANPVGPDSFTGALITELGLLSSAPSFTVGSLYNKLLCRMQNWMPTDRQRKKPPLHVVLTQNRKLPQSIQVSPLKQQQQRHSLNQRRASNQDQDSAPVSSLKHSHLDLNSTEPLSQSSYSPPGSAESHLSAQGSSPASSLSSEPQTCPRIAITIRLRETLAQSDLSVDLFADWVRVMPVLADHVKIEAGFVSCSTLLVLSLPIEMWCYLRRDPAISVMGFIKSPNTVPSALFSSTSVSSSVKGCVTFNKLS
jgi:hypothetical protein